MPPEDGRPSPVPPEVIAAWNPLAGEASVRAFGSGLLHQTFEVMSWVGGRAGTAHGDDESSDRRAYVLQRVSDVFSPRIHENIDGVTRHLRARGLRTFELVPTVDGALFADLGALGCWRLMSHLGGTSFDQIESQAQAFSAGRLVGKFHAALEDYSLPLVPMGLPFHDTPLYLSRMWEAVAHHSDHPFANDAKRLADAIRGGFESLGRPPEVLQRVIHGDLKISNILFEADSGPGRDNAMALIDFDTLMRGPLWCEWGDAWRSWCNRRGEDQTVAEFDLEVFESSITGFVEGLGAPIASLESASLTHATERLALELASRYVTDMLEESYFAWDRDRFESASEHNRIRAQGQLSLYASASECAPDRLRILEATR